jgi:23S rRNA pseudouridine2604 synthase
MRKGVYLASFGVSTKPCVVEKIDARRFKIILTQGLNRQIRRMCESFGFEVVQLRRLRFAHVSLGELQLGYWRPLGKAEIVALHRAIT